MRTLLILTALLEAATGLALSLSPALLVSLLLGAALDTPGGIDGGSGGRGGAALPQRRLLAGAR